MALLHQDNVNLAVQMAGIQQQFQLLINQGGAPPGGANLPAGGPLPAPGAGPGISVADRVRRAAKADFESHAAAWRAGRFPWAVRGQRGLDVHSKEMMQTVLVGLVECTDKVVHSLKPLSGFNVLDFCPVKFFGELF